MRAVYLFASFVMIGAYPFLTPFGRAIEFSLVSLGALVLVCVGVRTIGREATLPWRLLIAALIVINVGILIGHIDTDIARDLADLIDGLGNAIIFAAALVLVVRRGRNDLDGLIDSAIVGFAIGVIIWSIVMPPGRISDTSVASKVALFLVVFALTGVLGVLIRLRKTASDAMSALTLVTTALALALAANVVLALPTAAWLNVVASMMFMGAYTCVGLFGLDPAAHRLMEVGPTRPMDVLSAKRLSFLGGAVVAIPAVMGIQASLGGNVSGLLLVAGSAMVAALVMLRIGRLSTQRLDAERALRHQATHDGLTGLTNRHELLATLDRELTRGLPATILFCDLNGFKIVNDNLGHAAGDLMLIEVARRLQSSVRETDVVSRFGGDEFLILLRNSRLEDARAVCDRITAALSWPIELPDSSPTVGLSIGIAVAAGEDAEHLIGRADRAMYRAKSGQSWKPAVLVAEAGAPT
jgi:diguanylate cyclase (GGDEF)-like protein